MGNKDSSPISTFSDWQKVDTFNGTQIYRNKKNNQLAQKRIITMDPQYNMKQQLKVYSMREHNREGLVRALAVEDIEKQTSAQGLCSSQKKLCVLTEKIPYRLSQLPQLTFPQTLLILRQSLRGYQRIYKDYGPVQVSQQLIGLNYLGQVKCWLNENWALNHRSHEYMNLKTAKVGQLTKQQYLAFRGEYLDESEMVKSIVKAVEGKCEEGKFPVAFQEEVENQAGSFKKLGLYLKDFIEYNEIFVPEKLQYDALVKVRYQERLQHQLQINSGQNNHQESQMQIQSQDTVANNFIQSIFQLPGSINNPNLSKQTQPIPSQFPVPQQTKAMTPGLSNKQSPSGDTLGHITFTPTNRTYNFNEQSNQLSSASSKNMIANGNSFQATPNWKSNLQTVQTTYYNSGINTGGSSIKLPSLTTPTKPQIPSYQPTYAQITTSTYEPYQPNFSKFDSFSTVSNNTSIPSSQPASKYSYTYSNSFNSTSQLGGLSQNGSLNGNGFSGNGLSNYSLSYGTLKNSEASYTPNSNAFGYTGNGFGVGQIGNSGFSSTQQNVVQPYSKSSTYEERVYGVKGQQGTLFETKQTTTNPTTYEQFKQEFNQGQIIDGKTGQSSTQNPNPSQLGYTPNIPTTAYNFGTSPSFQLPSFTANSVTTGQPSTGFSFASNDTLNGKYNVTGYEGKGYTNTLTKYQTTKTKQSSQSSNYMQAFTSLLSPQIQQKISQANFTTESNFQEEQPQINVNTVSSKSTTPVASPRPSQTYSQNRASQGMATSNLTNEQQNRSENSFLTGLAKIVDRASNEVSDSVVKQFSN